MNARQWFVLVVGLVLFCAAGLYPMWTNQVNYPAALKLTPPQTAAGRAWLSRPPAPVATPAHLVSVQVDYRRMAVEWVVIGVPVLALLFALKSGSKLASRQTEQS